MNNQTVERIAYAHPAGFGIEHDIAAFFQISVTVEIGVAYPGSGFDNRYKRMFAYIIYQSTAASWNDKVDLSHGG